MTPAATVRPVLPGDLDTLLVLNNDAVPAVNALTRDAMGELIDFSRACLVSVASTGEFAGFALLLGPGLDYPSPNYRFFAGREVDFVYLDRVVVAPGFRRRGVATTLYDTIERTCAGSVFTCEVNVRPANEASLAFHAHRGFAEVGRQDTDAGAKTVALFRKALPR